ncbi:MAG: SDR family NAD(P)-dependent oxidoreductase, partial [Clostridia bacterium]
MKKTALITGASGDIGACIAAQFAKNGYDLLLHYNRDKNSCEKLRQKLENEYKITATLFGANFENESEVEGIAKRVRLENGGVDVLVNNAGVSLVELFQCVDNAAASRIFSVNLQNTMLLTQRILPMMISQKSGCIINISSMWGMVGASMEVHYSATKAGIIGMTKALAKEVGLSGVRVNCVCPGLIAGK